MTDQLAPTLRERMDKMETLAYLMEHTFNSAGEQEDWLHTEVQFFDDQKPVELLENGEIDRLIGVLAGHYTGAFV